jgi:DNA-binding transcriptional LysR family regulator
VRPTEEGARYFERCDRVVRDAEDADRALADLEGAPRGLVRVSAAAAMGGLISGIATSYLRAYPATSLEIVLADRRVDLIAEGFDLAIRAGAVRDSSLVVRRLGISERVLCAHADYLAARGAPKRPQDLRKHECIITKAAQGPAEWTLERGKTTAAVEVAGRYTVSSSQLARDGALAALGIANVPRFMVAKELAAGSLVEVLPDWPVKRGEIHLLYPSARQLSPRVRALIDLFIEAFR